MLRAPRLALALLLVSGALARAEWRVEIVPASGRVEAVATDGAAVRIAIGKATQGKATQGKAAQNQAWHRIADGPLRLEPAAALPRAAVPPGGLPDSRVATGAGARVWLAEPTTRYRHGVLGDAIEAGSLMIARDGGRARTLRLADDAVFEDLEPRIASIGGAARIVVVKSYLDRGSALAVVDIDKAAIIAETPPIGRPNAWLNPAGMADFDGDGTTDIALVRQPHVVGRLELWSWRDGSLTKTAELSDVTTHVIGSRVIGMSAAVDVDGDGRPDLALPSFDRRALRLIGFAPGPRDIARVALPARIVTNIGVVRVGGTLALVMGLESGALALVRN